jgi:putative transposase
MDWVRMLAYVTGTVDQELLAQNEYLAVENRIMKAQLKGRLKLSDAERGTLGEIGHRLGRKVLADVATIARPDTILGWYRKLVARKFDGSARRGPGRPRIRREVELLIIRMASENRDWGYDRIAGALANLGYEISDQTVGNVLQRHGLPPAPERKRTTTWAAFIRTHLALLAGTDFFTAEVLTLRGLVTYYVLFFIHLESRRVDIAGITIHSDERWMKQIARNATMEDCGALRDCRYLLHDRDTKFTRSFQAILMSGRVEPLTLPAHSPNLNAYAERWVRSVKEECLAKVILFGERSLRRALSEYVDHSPSGPRDSRCAGATVQRPWSRDRIDRQEHPGLAPLVRGEPAAGRDPRHRPDRRHCPGCRDRRLEGVRVGAQPGCLDWAGAQAAIDRWQG